MPKHALKIVFTILAFPVGGYVGVGVSLLFSALIGGETEGPRPIGGLGGIIVCLVLIWGLDGTLRFLKLKR